MPSKQKLRKRRHNQKHRTPYQRSQRAPPPPPPPPPKHDGKEEQLVESGGGQVATVQKLGCLTASLQQVRPDTEHQKDADRPEASTLQKDVDCAPHKRQALDAAADSILDETFETLGANEEQPAPSLNDCTSGQEQERAPPPLAAPQEPEEHLAALTDHRSAAPQESVPLAQELEANVGLDETFDAPQEQEQAPSPQQLETRVESLVDDTQEQERAPPINQLESNADESIFAPRENEMLSSRGDEETHFDGLDTPETSAPDAGTAGEAKDWTIPEAALEDDTRTTSHEDTRPPVGSQEVLTGVGLTALNMKHLMLRAWLHLGKMKLLQQGGRFSPLEQQTPQDPKADCMSAELQEKCPKASATSDNGWIVRDVSPRGDTVQTNPTPQEEEEEEEEEDTTSALPNIDATEEADDDDVASVEAETTSAPRELEGTAWEEQDVAAATAANPGNEMAQGDDVITFALSPVENDTYAEENIAALQAHWIAEALLEDDTSARLEIEMDVAPLGEKRTAEHFFGLHAEREGNASASTRAALERETTSESQTVHSNVMLKAEDIPSEPKLDDTAACGEEETHFESQTRDTKPVEEEMPLEEAHGDDPGAQKVQTVESHRDHPDPAWTGAALPANKSAEERTEFDSTSPEFQTNLVSHQVQEIRLEDTTSHEGDPSAGTPGEQTLEPQVTHGGDGSAPGRPEEGTGQASPNESSAQEEEKNAARPQENAAATSQSQQRETSAEREESTATVEPDEPVALVTALVSDKAPPPPNECGRTAAPGVVKKVKFYLDPDARAPSDHTTCSEDAGPSATAAAQKDEMGRVGPRHKMTFVLQEDETPSPVLQDEENVRAQQHDLAEDDTTTTTLAQQSETNDGPQLDVTANVEPGLDSTPTLPLEMEMQSESAPPEDDTPTSALQDETIVEPREEAAPEEVRNEPQEDGHRDEEEEEVTFTPDEYRSLLN